MTDLHLKGYPSTFIEIFDVPTPGRPTITSIEIPIFQRDFAQGRADEEASAIRERFLDAIVQACLEDDTKMALDFVYGDVTDGVLRPLDGQQRLTTLFLLHWYVASRAQVLNEEAPWLKFSYSTRPTARDFCEALAHHPYPGDESSPSEWISDQPWYVYPWRQDPTISSMLVMLDALHERFHRATNMRVVWQRLANREDRAIWFLFLPVADMDYGEDLYIKMNSRGKPLTPFEVFKADLEGMLKPLLVNDKCPVGGHFHSRYEHLTSSIDGAWADVFWQYEQMDDSDYLIDDEFVRYITFIVDVSEWRDGVPDRRWRDKGMSWERSLEERARLAFADPDNVHAARNREFFFHAFDTWREGSPSAEFAQLFSAGGSGDGALPLLVSPSPDLFGSCVTSYGREFSLFETLMLFAVLLARQSDGLETSARDRRLRTLRNLAESAFLDRKRMSEYVGTVERLMLEGSLDGAQGFNVEWTADEPEKWKFADAHPELVPALHDLEDLTVIRGRLFAFELDAASFDRRANSFVCIAEPALRDSFGAALLTKADYSRDVGWKGTRRQLGSSTKDDSWRDLFTAGSRASVVRTRTPLMSLLDDVDVRLAESSPDPGRVLDEICREWLAEREARDYFDWRYYFVRYAGARSSVGEGYFHNEGYDESRGGFSYGRLRMLHGGSYNAYFSDALLRAAWVEGDLADMAGEPKWWHRQDPGMSLKHSHVEIRCLDDGYELVVPTDADETAARMLDALQGFEGASGDRVFVQQTLGDDGALIDRQDRVQACISIVTRLHEAGL